MFAAKLVRFAADKLLKDIAAAAAKPLLETYSNGEPAQGWKQQANLRILLYVLRMRDGLQA